MASADFAKFVVTTTSVASSTLAVNGKLFLRMPTSVNAHIFDWI